MPWLNPESITTPGELYYWEDRARCSDDDDDDVDDGGGGVHENRTPLCEGFWLLPVSSYYDRHLLGSP